MPNVISKPKLVMVIDDDASMREVVREYITQGFGESVRVIEANDGLEATRKMEVQAFDCIITDLQMPRRDGLAFVKELKNSQSNKFAPIIVLTGYPDPEAFKSFKNVQMLEKPVTQKQLIKLVDTQLKLGRTDQRIPAEIISDFLGAALQQGNFLFENLAPSKPEVKKPGESLKGKMVTTLKVKTKDFDALIGIGISDDLVQHMASAEFAEQKKMDFEGAHNSLMNGIFRNMGRLIMRKDGRAPVLEDKKRIKDLGGFHAKEFSMRPALVVTLSCEKGQIFLYTFGGSTKVIQQPQPSAKMAA